MPIIRTIEYADYSEILDEIDHTEDLIKATAEMLEVALRCGDGLKTESHGVYLLLKRQADDLAFFRRSLATEIEDIKKNKLAVREPQEIAALTGLPAHIINSVVLAATGVRLGPCFPERRQPNA